MAQITGNTLTIRLERTVKESYDIKFGEGLFDRIAHDLPDLKDAEGKPLPQRIAIITDSNVLGLYGEALLDKVRHEVQKADIFSFPAGEENKTEQTCIELRRQMSVAGYGRDTTVIALGGGVVGDTAGFVAAVHNRGVPFIQVPTTLLAQADSSVGGKTGVDTLAGKNLAGAFWQPKRVYIDVSTLATLSDLDMQNGLAETIKHGVIYDPDFFEYLDENIEKILAKDMEALLYVAKENCTIKGSVVEIDPNEKGLRRILNYGHTAGHAIEKLSNYQLPHGQAVAIGMMVAGRIAMHFGHFTADDLTRQETLLKRAGLPTAILAEISDEDIIRVTTLDKKAKDGKARYCLPAGIGEMHCFFSREFVTYVDNAIVQRALEQTR